MRHILQTSLVRRFGLSEPVFLITGASGKLGREVRKLLPDALCPTREELDLTDIHKIWVYLIDKCENRDVVIIHLGAMTGIRQCEENKKMAWKTNVWGTQQLLMAGHYLCKNLRFIFMSTPCVFSGKEENYNEKSLPNPPNFYGLTKLMGEVATQSYPFTLIIRSNFIDKGKWPYQKAFVDRYTNYLWTHQLAREIVKLAKDDTEGIIHLVGSKKMSIYDFAKLNDDSVKPTTLEEYYGEKPNRPRLSKNMSLSSTYTIPLELD